MYMLCAKHLDCGTGTGKMCAGDGGCVEPEVDPASAANTHNARLHQCNLRRSVQHRFPDVDVCVVAAINAF